MFLASLRSVEDPDSEAATRAKAGKADLATVRHVMRYARDGANGWAGAPVGLKAKDVRDGLRDAVARREAELARELPYPPRGLPRRAGGGE